MTISARELFSSRIATTLTMIGVAVGLGNVWRFPYMMGQYGGSAFLVVYIVFVLIFAIPAVTAEWSLGRHARHGPIGAMQHAFGPFGRWIGYLLVLTVFIANSYYVVIVGNVAFSAFFAISSGFTPATIPSYEAGLGNGVLQALVSLFVIVAALWVIHRGISKGIEHISKLFVPLFGIMIITLIVMALRLPGAMTALSEFLRPDFSQLTPISLFAALGQAFFSLSLGGTFYLVYGSYLRDDADIPRTALATGLGDASAALLAALFIVPTVLALGLNMQAGPMLIFETLPRMFSEIPAGRVIGAAFLIGLWMMAFLSTVAAFQVIVAALTDSFKVSLTKAALIVGGCEALLMLPSALNPEIIGTLDLIFGSGMQMLGSALTIIALFWGCDKAVAATQIFGAKTDSIRHLYLVWLRWIVPAVLGVMLVLYIADSMRGML
ncbi:MAG: sodium-dependent transporter [Proteobacteria bacterium]|nr:sodium-dependent transporter [Pseudomonadota bacterium]